MGEFLLESKAKQVGMFSQKQWIGLVVGIIIPIIFNFFPTPYPLEPNAWLALGLLLGAVTFIICNTLRDYQAMILMCCMFVVTEIATFGVAFAPFSQGPWWMMFGALGIGVAAVKCGFMKRVAYILIRALPATYRGQVWAYILSGAILSPIIPSSTAKGVIMAPIAKSTSDAFGFKPNSKAAVGLYLAMFTGFVSFALTFLSGSAVNVSIVGALPEEYRVTWMGWFTTVLPWGVISTLLMVLVVFKFYAPKKGEGVGVISKEQIETALKEMGPWSSKEKITLVVLLSALAFWIFESQLGVNSTIVALMAFLILFATGVTTPDQLKNVGWEALFFVGAFLCLPVVFNSVGINAFVSYTLGDVVAPIMGNIFLLVPFIIIVTTLMRLVFVSLSGTAILVTAIFLPFTAQHGIHPFIIAVVSYMSTNTWNVGYQNTVTIAALAANGPEWIEQKDIRSGSYWYMATNFVALMLSVLYWRMIGMV